jgi:hypothetical protein
VNPGPMPLVWHSFSFSLGSVFFFGVSKDRTAIRTKLRVRQVSTRFIDKFEVILLDMGGLSCLMWIAFLTARTLERPIVR